MNLKALYHVKDVRHERPLIVCFHLKEMSKTGKLKETISRLVVARGWGMSAQWVKGIFWGDESILEL